MSIEVALLVSIVSVAFSIFFGLRGIKRGDDKEIEERVADSTRINIKLDNIVGTIGDVKCEVSSLREDMKSYNERLVKVEESVKSAHHRIDRLDKIDAED